MQRRSNLHRPRKGSPQGQPQILRGGGEHREHNSQLVLRERALHAPLQLHFQDGRRRRAPVEQAAGQGAVQVRAGSHGEDTQGRGRQELQVRVPERRRDGQNWSVPSEGAYGGGRRRIENKHNDFGAVGAAALGAVEVLRVAGEEESDEGEEQSEAVHTGLQAGVRALLHPRWWEGGSGRAAEESGAERVAHGTF
ncbi:hypothetical protein PIB30_023741 [Stylosanthes scabra]|uniref:Uncharacterized protein n=1 Tax=Stylosanthes scabra TaxID=79078 RepID=A0ABU6W9E3_9FABA|nr:hypothetical protein [Stylosanthes scabra]